MRTTSITVRDTPLMRYVLSRADDALILGHRLSEWIGHGPILEEEMALGNIGLDLIGQARALYAYAAALEGEGRDEDQYAFLRDARQFGNLLLVERPNGDFAQTMVRQLFFSAFADLYWRAMMRSTDPTLAAIAARSEKESAYHLRHAAEWVVRLGDGTEESHRRAQEAVDLLFPHTGEMFECDRSEQDLVAAGAAIDPATQRDSWDGTIGAVLARATLTRPEAGWMQTGGRTGRHSEHLGHLLAVMQVLPRTYPGARW